MCDMIYTSNPVLADCPPIKEEQDMNRQSDKITAIYCRLSRDDDSQERATALSIKRRFSKNTHKNKVFAISSFSWTMVTPAPTSTDPTGNE